MTNQEQFKSFAPAKSAFVNTWPGGYRENFSVYKQQCDATEEEIVSRMLRPFFNKEHTALEIGCGGGYFTEKYLLPNFRYVYALDLIPPECAPRGGKDGRLTYIELPESNYSCYGIEDETIDFAFSFGCFCHIPLWANKEYVRNIYRVLRSGGIASLFFSNTERRIGTASVLSDSIDPKKSIMWCDNDWRRTHDMLQDAGFVDIVDIMPKHCNTLVSVRKP